MKSEQRLRSAALLLVVTLLLGGVLMTWILLGNQSKDESNAAAPYHPAGRYRVRVEIRPQKPRIGRNALFLTVQDADGMPVRQAQVAAVAEMPAMGAMPAMQAPVAIAETAPGRYEGAFELAMDGAWPLTLTLNTPEFGTAELKFDLTTSRAGLRLIGGAPATGEAAPSEAPEDAKQTAGTIRVDARRRQLIGVTTAVAVRRPLIRILRAAARVAYDETALTDVSLKFDGWIGTVAADFVGTPVEKGRVLFTVYSPGLVSAQEEYLESLHRGRLVGAARRRLALWDIGAAQIRALEKRGRPATYLPILSPATGTVIDKHIVAGSPVKAGEPLLRIVDLSTVWVDADVYESEIPWVQPGMDAVVTLSDLPGRAFRSTVSYVYPYLRGDTRTARLRIELPNPEGLLRPAMFGTAELAVDLGERLAVPESAVIYSGKRRYVFVDRGDGRLGPRRIEIGARTEAFVEVMSGLSPGETVVTSGNFLIASESKLKAGLEQW